MGSANVKVVSLSVKPLRASHLCFEVNGILDEWPRPPLDLGTPVVGFDLGVFYSTFRSSPLTPGEPFLGRSDGDGSRLSYDDLTIQANVSRYALAALRAEPTKAALNKAINARQNA